MTVLNLSIAASEDDASERSTGSVYSFTDAHCEATSNDFVGYRFAAGFRFQNVTIPAGATINSAVLSLRCYDTSSDDANVRIYAHDDDDAPHFDDGSGGAKIYSRTFTSAFEAWAAAGLGTGVVASPDLASVIQEVIDRGGWSSGQALALIVDGLALDTTGDVFRIRSYDYDGTGGNSPTLAIDYTASGDASAEEMAWHAETRRPPIEELLTETFALAAEATANIEPIVAPEAEPAAGLDAAAIALPPEFPIEDLAELSTLPLWAWEPLPDVVVEPADYLDVAAAAEPPEFPVEEIADLIPSPSVLWPEDMASSIAGAAAYLMVPEPPVAEAPDSRAELGDFALYVGQNLLPLPDAANSFPGTAIVTRVGVGTAQIVALQSGLYGDPGPYTAIVTPVGPGAARVYRRSDP